MVGEHVTMGGEADAETELDVSEAEKKSPESKAGTGAVHTAPGHGHDDFVIGKRYGLEIYCPVDNAGRFTPEVEHFAGVEFLKLIKRSSTSCASRARCCSRKITNIDIRIVGGVRIQ